MLRPDSITVELGSSSPTGQDKTTWIWEFSSTTATDSGRVCRSSQAENFANYRRWRKPELSTETNQQEIQIAGASHDTVRIRSTASDNWIVKVPLTKSGAISAAVRRQDEQQFANSSNRQNPRLGKAAGNELEHLGQFFCKDLATRKLTECNLLVLDFLLGSGVKLLMRLRKPSLELENELSKIALTELLMTWRQLENVRRTGTKVKNIHLASAAGSRTIRNYTRKCSNWSQLRPPQQGD